MPTYDYRCNACEHEFELFQPMSARPKRKCPRCGKLKLERLIGTGSAIIFKGSGFYQTDYRSESYKKAAKADTEATKNKPPADSSPDTTKKTPKADKPAKQSKSPGKGA